MTSNLLEEKHFNFEVGKGAGRKTVEPLIEEAEENLLVVSPYLSSNYAERLREKSEEGTSVKIVTTSDDSDFQQDSLEELDAEKFPLPEKFSIGGVIASAVFLIFSLSEFRFFLAGFFSITLAGFVVLYKRVTGEDRDSDLSVIFASDLHAKLYSRDDAESLVFGSGNLTNNGMRNNVEIMFEADGELARVLRDSLLESVSLEEGDL